MRSWVGYKLHVSGVTETRTTLCDNRSRDLVVRLHTEAGPVSAAARIREKG